MLENPNVRGSEEGRCVEPLCVDRIKPRIATPDDEDVNPLVRFVK